MTTASKPHIAVIGGTGAMGKGIAYRLLKAGYQVTIGTRNPDSSSDVIQQLQEKVATDRLQVATNSEAATNADLVFVTVPFAHQEATLRDIAPRVSAKVVIDATVALNPPRVNTVHLRNGESAGMAAQQTLGDSVKLVSAFQNVAAASLLKEDNNHCDVLVTGNDRESCDLVCRLIGDMGFTAFYAGAIQNSIAVEAMTSVLIQINRHYGVPGAGLQINLNHPAGNA